MLLDDIPFRLQAGCKPLTPSWGLNKHAGVVAEVDHTSDTFKDVWKTKSTNFWYDACDLTSTYVGATHARGN